MFSQLRISRLVFPSKFLFYSFITVCLLSNPLSNMIPLSHSFRLSQLSVYYNSSFILVHGSPCKPFSSSEEEEGQWVGSSHSNSQGDYFVFSSTFWHRGQRQSGSSAVYRRHLGQREREVGIAATLYELSSRITPPTDEQTNTKLLNCSIIFLRIFLIGFICFRSKGQV